MTTDMQSRHFILMQKTVQQFSSFHMFETPLSDILIRRCWNKRLFYKFL